MLNILYHHIPVHFLIQFLINLNQPGKIFPASWSCKIFTIHSTFHFVKIRGSCIQVRNHSRMNSSCIRILSPCIKIRFHLNFLHTVHSYHIKFSDRLVIFRWISCCHNQPAFRNFMASKGFTLKKLQHGRCQCLRNTVNLINKQNSLLQTRLLYLFINRRHNFTHGVFRNSHLSAVKFFPGNKGQTNGTLSGVVCDRIRNQSNLTLSGNLLHDLRLADSGCTDKKNRTLRHNRNLIFSIFIFQQISLYCITYFFLCPFDIHNVLLT